VPLVRGILLGGFWLLIFSRDVNSYTKGKNTIEPTTVFKGHASVVGVRTTLHVCRQVTNQFVQKDVDWHATKENVFSSVGDDKMLLL
jgi:histone-binding protein RBBP4